MPGVAAYKAQLKLGGTPTVFTDEPLTELSAHVYRIADSVKRVISANHEVEVAVDGGGSLLPEEFSVNYLDGIIYVLTDDVLGEDLVVTGRYIPLVYIGGSKEYSCEIGGDVLDSSSFHSESTLSPGYREKVCGIHDISVSFSRWNDFSNALTNAKLNKTPVFVSINPGASSTFIKGWFQIETDSLAGDIGSLEDQSFSLALCGNNSKTYFSYSYNYTDIEAQAMDEEDLIANWFPEA